MVRFSSFVLLFDILMILLAGLPLWLFVSQEVFLAVLLSLVITTTLGILSFIPFTRMSAPSMNRFMAAMLGAMMIRMVFIGVAVVVVFIFTEMNQIAFTVALLFSYICKSALETYMLTRRKSGHTAK